MVVTVGKLTISDISFLSVLLWMINCVITLSKWLWKHELQASGSAVNFAQINGFY